MTTATTTVLIVEDERIIAKGIEKAIKGLGYAVAGSVGSGEEGIHKAETLRPNIVLMDIHLQGGMDGIEAAGIVRNRLGIPVVFLTAHSDDSTIHRAKLTEPFGYVLKPFEDRDLQTAIEIGMYRHRMEQRLRENEQWLSATLASIGDGVIATDEQGRVRFINSVAEHLTGWTQAEAFTKSVVDIFHIVHEHSRTPVPNPALEALAKGVSVTLADNTMLIARDRIERPIDDSAAPIRDVNGNIAGSVLVFRDITERRRLEDHLRQAQKMEAIGRLAGGIAHDFNNIMTIITGFGEVLLQDDPPTEQRREFIRNICDAGKRAAALTQQIMAFSRKQMLVPTVLNLNTVVRDMAIMVKRLIGSNIEFVTETAANLGQIKADPTQLGQVILNLAANARDAMPKGGRLVVSTDSVTLGEEITRKYPDVSPGNYALLAVSDTGSGMSDEVLAHIFEPFFTTKEFGQGAGLGLATVHGIVKQSGGHIEASSKVGVGSTFRIYLPIVDDAPAQDSSQEERVMARGHETILLVEDEAMVRGMTKLILSQNGYTVLEAGDGLEAIEVAKQHDGPLHLLMTDLVMPKLSGREMADQLTAIKPGLRVLFMSGYTEDVVVLQGVQSAEVDFLQKPFSLAALTTKVREILDRQ